MGRRILGPLVAAYFLGGCVSLRSVSQTQIPRQRTQHVSAESSKWIFFGFNFDNDYVDVVRKELRSQCPRGKVTGILTKDENINYFIGLVMKRRIEARGFCVKA